MHLPLQPEELLPLPEGVPEEVAVHCNGRSALLVVRTQRVLHQGQDISASKFESLCGKGDAKKWKCSLWLEDEEGEPVMVSLQLSLKITNMEESMISACKSINQSHKA